MSEMWKIERKPILENESKQRQADTINRGSTVVEMTLLMPVILGVVYFGILFFLFLIRCGSCMEELAKCLYEGEAAEVSEREDTPVNVKKKGSTKTVWMEEEGKLFQIQLELKGNSSDPVSAVRRWQIAVDTVSQ